MGATLLARRSIVKSRSLSFQKSSVGIPGCPKVAKSACFQHPGFIQPDPEIYDNLAPVLPAVGPGIWTHCRMLDEKDAGDLLYIAMMALGLDESLEKFADNLILYGLDFSPLQIELCIDAVLKGEPANSEGLLDLSGADNYFFVNNGGHDVTKPSVSVVTLHWKNGRDATGIRPDYWPLQGLAGVQCLPGDVLHLRNCPLTLVGQ